MSSLYNYIQVILHVSAQIWSITHHLLGSRPEVDSSDPEIQTPECLTHWWQ